MKQTFQTIDFAERLGAPFVVLHLGEVPMRPITDPLIELAKAGKLLSREICESESESGGETRKPPRPRYLERVKDCLRRIVDYAAAKNSVGIEGRRGYEEIPSERELPALLDEIEFAASRLLARLRSHSNQRKSDVSRSRGVVASDWPARFWLSRAGLHLAGAGSSTAFYRRCRS